MWLRTSCCAPHCPAHTPACDGVECPRSCALDATSAGGRRAARRASIVGGIWASVASCTRSERRPGVERTSGVSWDASDVSPRIASFLGAASVAGSCMMYPMHGSSTHVSGNASGCFFFGSTRTSVYKWPCAYVYGSPRTRPLCKVPPEAVLVTEHVLPWLLVDV
jgi:hypothetical protein